MSDDVADRLTAALAYRYTIDRELGAGGMATVYLAHDVKHDRKVAVKVLHPELAAVLGSERFVQEIKTTANLQHPHILPLFDSGEADGFLYYVMPYIEGEALRDKLNRERQLGVEEAVRTATEVADALDYAHRQDVIHRDIKPENILLHDGRPVVADFGIALAVSAAAGGRMTETGLSLGTPHYMSPEQATAEKDLSNRSDIYSLGCVLYEMLTGDPPHVGSTAQQIIMKIVTEEVAPVTSVRKSVPPNVAAAIAQSLEKLPADRFERAAKFAEALQNVHFTRPATTQAAERRRPYTAIAATAVITSAVTAVAMLAVLGTRDDSTIQRSTAIERPITFSGRAANVSIAPDGLTLAYETPAGLVTRDVRGGIGNVVSSDWQGGVGGHPRWNADGSQILFGRMLGDPEWAIWAMPRLGGTPSPVLITKFESGQPLGDFVPFPDGERILVIRVLEPATAKPWLRIYTPPSDSSVGVEVDTGAIRVWDATVSPDNQWIAYVAERIDGSAFIGTVSVGGDRRNVAVEGGQDLTKWEEISSHPNWPLFRTVNWAAGNRLYYRRHGGRGMDIYVVEVDLRTGGAASLPRAVVQGLRRGTGFDVSRDASRLAYVGGVTRAHVHMMRLEAQGTGFRVRDATLTRGTGWNVVPRISPDGRRVAFVARTFDGADILVTGHDDLSFRRLSPLSQWRAVRDMEWSSDGEQLLAHVETAGGTHRLLIIDVADGRVTDLGEIPPLPVQMAWSPDGRFALYGNQDASQYLARDLTTGTTTAHFASVGDELIHARFSPDSRYVLAQDLALSELWISPIEGGEPLSIGRIHDGLGSPTAPRVIHWSPDGRIWILDPGSRTLATMPWTGGELQEVAELPELCAHEGMMSMTMDARVLLCSVVEREADVWVIDDFDPAVTGDDRSNDGG
jgi:tRNA A-37 threonylcarbamoyl transferase component Bud32